MPEEPSDAASLEAPGSQSPDRPPAAASGGLRTTLTCYNDTHGYGWRHVDLFVRDAQGVEVNWVHWQAPADGPQVADEVTRGVEPLLRRTSEWRHGVSANGMDFWEADASWIDE